MKTIFGKTVPDATVRGIPVTIEYRKVKNINLYIKPPEGNVLITAPKRTSKKRIMQFVEEKADWIEKARLRVMKAQEKREVEAQDEITQDEIHHLKEMAAVYIAKWEPIMGVRSTGWTFRYMKTRWGSCTVSTGRIRLNTRLVRYPEECLEYVIVHELCHLIEPSHNARFHKYMSRFLPDWKARKALLKM